MAANSWMNQPGGGIGLDSVASADRAPALTLIHLSFDAMVGLAFLLIRVRPHAHVPGSDDNGGVIDSLTAIVVYVVLGVANLLLLRMLARRRRLPANRAGDPFFMGTVIGAIASGRVPANPARSDLAVRTGPTSLLIGALFVAVRACFAALFLIRRQAAAGMTASGDAPPSPPPWPAFSPERFRSRRWQRSTARTRLSTTGLRTGPCRSSSWERAAELRP
jgi:hypothetical protein